MKKIGSVVLCCLGVTAVGASGALAQNGNSTPNPSQVASQQCAAQLEAMGAKAFKGLHGKKAMKACKAKSGESAKNLVNNAAQQCRAEQSDPATIPGNTSNPPLSFDEFYGTNENDRNAFGKCVSGKVRAAEDENEENLQNAAQQCRAERKDPSTILGNSNPVRSFKDFYGSNKNKKNAFGKCVSQKAKAQGSAPAPTT